MHVLTLQSRNSIFFRDDTRLQKLNVLFEIHTTLSPSLIMSATNCDLSDALAILILLYEKYYADARILVYHRDEPDQPFQRRPFSDGLPKIPLAFDGEFGVREVTDAEELFVRFEFDLQHEDIQIAK